MKLKSYFKILKYLLALSLLASCEAKWVEDPVDPRLPKFTMEGNNVAGAILDNGLWKSEWEWIFPIFFPPSPWDMPSISLYPDEGKVELKMIGARNFQEVLIMISVNNTGIHNEADLYKLEGMKFALDTIHGVGVTNYVNNIDSIQPLRSCVGQVYFAKATSPPGSNNISIAGTFGFTYVDKNWASTDVFFGRFDFKDVTTISHYN